MDTLRYRARHPWISLFIRMLVVRHVTPGREPAAEISRDISAAFNRVAIENRGQIAIASGQPVKPTIARFPLSLSLGFAGSPQPISDLKNKGGQTAPLLCTYATTDGFPYTAGSPSSGSPSPACS